MITSIIFLIFFGCFALYNASKKVALNQYFKLETWLQNNEKQTKIIGVFTLVITAIISVFYLGVTSGILFWLITLMTVLCLIVILYPIKGINYKHIISVFVFILLFELILI